MNKDIKLKDEYFRSGLVDTLLEETIVRKDEERGDAILSKDKEYMVCMRPPCFYSRKKEVVYEDDYFDGHTLENKVEVTGKYVCGLYGKGRKIIE